MKDKFKEINHKYDLKKFLGAIGLTTAIFASPGVIIPLLAKLASLFSIANIMPLTLTLTSLIYIPAFIYEVKLIKEGLLHNKSRKGLFMFNNKILNFNNEKVNITSIEQNPLSLKAIKSKLKSIGKKNNIRDSFNFLTSELYDTIKDLDDSKTYGCSTHPLILKLLDKLEQLGYIKELDYCCSIKTTNLSAEKKGVGNNNISNDKMYLINVIFKKGNTDISKVSYSELMHQIVRPSKKIQKFLNEYKKLNDCLKINKTLANTMVNNFNKEFIKYKENEISEKKLSINPSVKDNNEELSKNNDEIEKLKKLKSEVIEHKLNNMSNFTNENDIKVR